MNWLLWWAVFNYCFRIYWLVFLLGTLRVRQGVLSVTPFQETVAVSSLSYILIINLIVVKSIPWPVAIPEQQLKQQSGRMLHRT